MIRLWLLADCNANLEAVLQAEEPTRPEPAQQDDQNDTEAYIDALETILETTPQPQQPGSQLQQHHQQQPTPVTHYRRIAPKPLPPAPPVPISHISPCPTFVPSLISPPATISPGLIPLLPNGPIFSPITNQGGVIMGPFGGIHAFHPYNLGINPTIPMASRPIGVACAPEDVNFFGGNFKDPRVRKSVRREWHFPDWELREPLDPREAMQEAKQRQIRFVDFQGRPWGDSNPQPPSVQDDSPFALDKLVEVTRYVEANTFQTKCDDKSGYDHVAIQPASRRLLGFQWAGFWLVCNTLPFGFKASAFIYNTLGLAASGHIRSLGVPVTQYIDDRHAGQLQMVGAQDQRGVCSTQENFQRAEAAVFIMTTILVRVGHIIGLEKSVLNPTLCLTFLGYTIRSLTCLFGIPTKKKQSFKSLRQDILSDSTVGLKTLQRFVGKAVSFILAVPAARLFTRECNSAIGKAIKKVGRIRIVGDLRKEIQYWAFVDDWGDDWPWKEERHVVVSIASDASGAKWGGVIQVNSPRAVIVGDMWLPHEKTLGIPSKEALALYRVLQAAGSEVVGARVDAFVDSRTVIDAWKAGGGRAKTIFDILKSIFHLTIERNCTVNLHHVRSAPNPADRPSRTFAASDAKLSPTAWSIIERHFGLHVIDGMALPSNAQTSTFFSRFPTPGAAGVNFFAQTLAQGQHFHGRKGYLFPPICLIASVLAFLKKCKFQCTLVVPEFVPAKVWRPVLESLSGARVLLGREGTVGVILYPSPQGFVPAKPLPWNLWAHDIRPSRQDDFPRPGPSRQDDFPRPAAGPSRQADMEDDVRRLTDVPRGPTELRTVVTL
ncbi:Hypp6635 [Branchiostoma lanceolatum]|uniref:Hypp6635 protein n=1 Tax=Branchiostoma lanceolatum TaxID=7740 RepID=A0A8J9YVA8_BRALA|nr:Hypp6635 [Branchiostoma lanceolatum]